MWYFLPPNEDADYLVETLLNQNRASWFKPPHYTIVISGDIFVVLKNSFRFQGRLHHGIHEAIVQWRIVVVFKHQRIYGYRPSHPAYSPSSAPCCAVNSHPVSFLYSRGRAPSSPQQAGECSKLHKPPPLLRLSGTNLPPSSSWHCRSY